MGRSFFKNKEKNPTTKPQTNKQPKKTPKPGYACLIVASFFHLNRILWISK